MLGEGGTTLKDTKQIVDDPSHLKRAKIRRMYLDDSGVHCFLVSDTEIFYNHWDSDFISRIDVFTEEHFKIRQGNTINQMIIKSIEVSILEDNLFEILLGTGCGHILHGCYLANPQ